METQNSQDEEKALKIEEYKQFIYTLFDKRKELQKFTQGVKGLRENAVKQDMVTLKNLETYFNDTANEIKEKGLSDKITPLELINNLKEGALQNLQVSLKQRREFDKYFDQVLDNFVQALQGIDKVIIDKVLELINNIEESNSSEMEKLKVKIADLVTENQQLKMDIEALRKGIKPKPKEIPSIEDAIPMEVQCPICLQVHRIVPGTKEYKCPICGYNIKVSSEEQ